jgi:hypothetical protein
MPIQETKETIITDEIMTTTAMVETMEAVTMETMKTRIMAMIHDND